MPYGIGDDEAACDYMYYYPECLQEQCYPGFAKSEDGHPGTILIVGAHEMPGRPGPDAFETVQWNCSSSVDPLRACVDASASTVVVTRSK
jgi:hypothetical protein